MNQKTLQKKEGFTLLELMIAMGIMAVLVTLSLVGISTVQRSLRNTQRQDIVKTVNLELQGFFNDFGQYPTSGSGGQLQFHPTSITLDDDANTATAARTIETLKGATQGKTGTYSASSVDAAGTYYCYSVNTAQSTYGLAVALEGKTAFQSGTATCDVTQNAVTP